MVSFKMIALIGAILAYLLIRIAEHRQHLANYRFLKFIEGKERISKTMKVYYGLDYFLVVMVLVEFFLKKNHITTPNILIGASLLISGGMLRYWAINSLDRMWSKRCIYVPGLKKMSTGPYRYFKHPEYFSRFLDGFGLCILFGSFISGVVFLFASIILLNRIIKVESSHIEQLSREES